MKHLPHYISLIAIFVMGAFGFYYFSYDRAFQIAVVIALAVSYVSWGVVHHMVHKDISMSVVLEYVAVSVLGTVIVLSLII